MAFAAIKKYFKHSDVAPNLTDYERACATFSWETAERELRNPQDQGALNIAYSASIATRIRARRDHLALRWLSKSGEARDITYGELRRLTNRFANVLRGLGVGKGDRVFALAGRIPELYIAALGTLKNGSVFCPLFSAFRS